jgi:hypothetical protein
VGTPVGLVFLMLVARHQRALGLHLSRLLEAGTTAVVTAVAALFIWQQVAR